MDLRTSTKSGGAMTAGTAALYVLGIFFPDFTMSLTPEQAMLLGSIVTAIVGWIAARLSKTPANPGLL